jgi:Zn-dependent metalloprotease
LVRSAGEPEVSDVEVNEAATGVTETLALYADLGRSSYDDKGATVVSTVHYEKDYDNAFWDGNQLVFGDGDGKIFGRFTKPIDVLGHELSHAVTQYSANLTYSGQSGALNESLSDCFGSCVKQRHLSQDAASADWLIGEGIFLPSVKGVALRSMKAPGTAYDDPTLGKDPQVASMDDYVDTQDDDGGVHTNSGIPNKAFYLAATAIGGNSWEGAGRIWYSALTSGIPGSTDFAGFAAACLAAAGDHAEAVAAAWQQVGVAASPGSSSAPAPAPAPAVVEVTRSGGFGGLVKRGSLDLASDDPRSAEASSLLERIDFAGVREGDGAPDRYVYEFRCDPHRLRVHETALTQDLRRLADLVLE